MEKIGCSEKLNDSIARIPEKRSNNKKRKPNVIRFNTKNDKFEVLKKSSTKRDENEQKDIYVNPDLSKKERMKAFEIGSDLRWKKKQ